MKIDVSMTADGTKKYPLHRHSHYEVMLYVEGRGNLRAEGSSFPFSEGSIIIVPPGVLHGSESEDGFKNISVGADFEGIFSFREIYSLTDNEQGDGRTLAELIYKNRYSDESYLSSLLRAYSAYLIGCVKIESPIARAVEAVVAKISEGASDPDFDTGEALRSVGYAEDYVRDKFKAATGYTPVAFLTKIRTDRARYLIDIFGASRSLSEIAEASGYTDYVYFSKKFKASFGICPRKYLDKIRSFEKNPQKAAANEALTSN